jgi:predicted phosphodiesterase
MGVRVQVLSDVHVEFHRDQGKSFVDGLDPSGVDVLVLAGDIGVAAGIKWALEKFCSRYERATVLFTPGNHEYYRSYPAEMDEFFGDAEAKHKNLRILRNRIVEVGGVRFAGTTLWFRDDPLNRVYQGQLSDFSLIEDFVPWVYNENRLAEAFLRGAMAMPRPPEVVITHHLPSDRCVAAQYKGSTLNRFFVAPIADTMPVLPKLWIYGHTHTPLDAVYDGCRLITNPFGYPHEPKRGFREKLIIEVEPTPPLASGG